ncbi:tail terminator [Mycobacterium phage Typha]|uniref:Tail terminator n=1 Tax=Mycobacterium phage Typha TaxID=2517971 RepID=A0A482JAK2_9CAUD|nr:tail terminator [Mycobacterium phage Typha]QBP29675.1 tail terminator [Mycobacterium phage Typha]URM86462.1 tail terminator [Mycobacterium phage Hilltopfarm]
MMVDVAGESIYPPILPPDLEELSVNYLMLKMAVAMGTRLPKTPAGQSLPDPFVRVQFGGGVQVNPIEFDIDTIIHSYHADETLASLNCRTAFAHMVAARGLTVDGWFISGTRGTSLPHRMSDPQVPLPRYRAMVCWRVQGQLITPQ